MYNYFLFRLNQHDEIPAMTTLRSELPDLKQWWTDLGDVYSRTLQVVVERLYDNLSSLKRLKEEGYRVGSLNWKPPREFRSFTYSQRGFKFDKKGGRAVLSLSKIGDIPISLHREIPEPRKSVPNAVFRPTNRCGFGNTRVRRAVSSATVTRTPPSTSFLAVLKT